ncbi:Transposase [Bacteroidales bacterium Barb6]|nr:Transposase [Bacteroidales bacterium Barb6]
MDATGCQRDIAARITEKGADYLLAVKGSQGCLEEDAERTVRFTRPTSEWMEEDSGHGRVEQRKCTLYTDLSFIDRAEAWKNPSATVKMEAARYIKSSGKEEKEVRLYITSSKADAEVTGKGVRSHWGIENNLHWQSDVSFNEDESRKREGYAAQNFSLLNQIALNPVKHEQSKKRSVKGKRLDAGWNNDYLLKILTNYDAFALLPLPFFKRFKAILRTIAKFSAACLVRFRCSSSPKTVSKTSQQRVSMRPCPLSASV